MIVIHMYTCSTDSISHLRHWCSVNLISKLLKSIRSGYSRYKMKNIKFPLFQPFGKPEQAELLPGRRPIIQIAERPSSQHSQSKTRVKNSVPKSSSTKSSEHHDKVIPVFD